MATWEPVLGEAASTVRDWLGGIGREAGIEVGIVILIALGGVLLAAAVALAPWPWP